MLIMYFIKLILRKKWTHVKNFIIMPVVLFLPYVIYADYINFSFNNISVLSILAWGMFYFSIFESVMQRFEAFNDEKIQDIIMSGYSVLKFDTIRVIAVNIVYIPSMLFTLFIYSIITGSWFSASEVLIVISFVLINNIIFNFLTCAIHFKFNNYFQKLNLAMDVLYIISGVIYPVILFPFILKIFSYLIPFTYVSMQAQNINYSYLIFISIIVIYVVVGYIIFKNGYNKFKDRGGKYG